MELKYIINESDPVAGLAHQAFLEEEARQQYLHDFNTAIKYARMEGYAEGKALAKIEHQIRFILRTLTKRFQVVPQQIEKKIFGIDNLDYLKQLADLALEYDSIEEFGKALK